MKRTITLTGGTPRSVFSKTWTEPELKSLIQELALDRGMKDSPFIRWLIIAGIRAEFPNIKITETATSG